ncbi:protease FtsH-inhibitory lysogeny factor CIII [Escherichia coli]|nr:protease FtsH-inhibitory lysogeny factor CIII [Escherichia coli]
MQYAIAGWPAAGCPSESLLERITRKLRDGWKRLIDILNQPEYPKWIKTYGYPDKIHYCHFYWR